jgi:hypothetical protein
MIFIQIIITIVALYGVASLTQATLGVGLLALACELGIVARLAQARSQHNAQMKLLAEIAKVSQPPVTSPSSAVA